MILSAMTKGRHFRIYDDDGFINYSGRFYVIPGREEEVSEFEPLDDFGTPNAGATTIKYRDPQTGKWESL